MLYLFLLCVNFFVLQPIKTTFCDIKYKDSMLSFGGIFSIDGTTIFATRADPMRKQPIVWRFDLKVIDNEIEINGMSSLEINRLFPGLVFEYFASGFTISDTNSCDDTNQQCLGTSWMKNLTLVLGPKTVNSKQQYIVYRFNGTAFRSVDPKTDYSRLASHGNTSERLTFITTTYDNQNKQIIAFNFEDKSLRKLDLNLLAKMGIMGIESPQWDSLIAYVDVESSYYHLIEIKVTQTRSEILLITERMVYQLVNRTQLKEVMHPWQLFGCEPNKVSVHSRLRRDANQTDLIQSVGLGLDRYEDVGSLMLIQLLLANAFYIAISCGIFYFIYRHK